MKDLKAKVLYNILKTWFSSKERKRVEKLSRKADKDTIKFLNRQSVLNIIRKREEISRTDLTNETRLSPTTISAITSDLVKMNLVREIRVGESSGGRPPVIFGINPNAAYCIAIRITPKGALVTIVNTSFKILYRKEIVTPIYNEITLKDTLKASITHALEDFCEDIDLISGIAVSIPGLIDYENSTVIFCSSLHIENFNLQEIINEIMPSNKKAYIFKDADALLLGEYSFDLDAAYKNVIYILIENGVGMSYIHSGKLFKLPQGGFELGHMTIDPTGPLCRCGNKGCLDAMVSEDPAIKRLKELLEEGSISSVKEVKGLRYEDIIELGVQGDQACSTVLQEQFYLLGIGIANIINIFNPQLIILGGAFSHSGDEIVKQMKQIVFSKTLKTFSENTQIYVSRLGRDSSFLGMSKTVFEDSIFKMIKN